MKKYNKKTEKLNTFEFENGIILPQKRTDSQYPLWGLGGVCDSNNEFADVSFYDGGWATHGGKYQWDSEDYIDEDVVYIGPFLSHWGHFLIDLSCRLWYVQELCKSRHNFKVAYLGNEVPSGSNLTFFRLLGIEDEQLFQVNKPTRFKKVIVPEQSFKSCEWFTDEHIKMFDNIYTKVLSLNYDFSNVNKLKKVYFTRCNFKKAVTSEFGEKFFENTFCHNGYTAVAPETLTLEEQIYLWNNANEIVCINGTIPLNVIFSQNTDLKLTVLNKTSILHENPYILLMMRNIKSEFIDIYNEPLKKYPKSLGEGPYLLEYTEDFKKYCQKKKFTSYQNDKEIKKLFSKSKRDYYLSIIAVKRRIKDILRYIVPNNLLKNRK